MKILPLDYESNGLLLAVLDPEHYITENKRVVYKLTAENAWVKPVVAIHPTKNLELSDEEYDDLTANWRRWQEFKSVRKHMAGLHDQSTHAHHGVTGVAHHIDLQGLRMDSDAVNELRHRNNAYLNARNAARDIVSRREFGSSWQALDGWTQAAVNQGLRPNGNGDYITNSDGSSKKFPTLNELIDAEPIVAAAKQKLTDHFLYKDASSLLVYNEDGTRGPATIGTLTGYDPPMEKMLRCASVKDFQTGITAGTVQQVHERDANGNYTVQSPKHDITITADDAPIAEADWVEFGKQASPTLVVSNKSLRSILKDGRVKSYTEANRPARAGNNSVEYKNNRAVYENLAFGYNDSDPAGSKPISTFISASREIHPDLLNGYGGTQIILKQSVKDRMTVTRMDSLNSWARPQSYKDFFQPTNYSYYLGNRAVAERKVNKRNYFTSPWFTNQPEGQVHGGITTKDIEKIVFQDKAPAMITSVLDKQGIPYEVIPTVENHW